MTLATVLALLALAALCSGLGLIMMPAVGGREMLLRALVGRGGLVTAATNASPTVITAGSDPQGGTNQSSNHGLANGNSVYIGGAAGNTAINGGPFTVYNVTTTTFQIMTVTTTVTGTAVNGNGVFSGTCLWSLGGVEDVACKLFSSNTTPAEGDTAGTYTEVANGGGYTTGGQTLSSRLAGSGLNVWGQTVLTGSGGTGNWAQTAGGSFTGSTNVPEDTATQLTWTGSGNWSTYGYYVVGATTGLIYWSERFPNPPINISSGAVLNLTNRFGMTHS